MNRSSQQAEDDRAFCVEMLPAVSRTFALSIEALPPSLARPVRVAYLLCRIADSIEDASDVRPSVREAMFAAFELTLAFDELLPETLEELCADLLSGVPEAERALASRAGAVLRELRRLPESQREAIRSRVGVMVTGMREYARRGDACGTLRLQDVDDLERYCYFVAGTVGELLTTLFVEAVGPVDRRTLGLLRDRAVSFGLGLQLVNILKDVAIDAERDVCFLPESLADDYGVDLYRILEPALRQPGLGIIAKLADRARHHLRLAAEYTLLWPASDGQAVRLFCVVPLVLALQTLDEVEYGDDTLRRGREPKVSRQTVAKVLTDAQQAVGSDGALRRLLAPVLDHLPPPSPPVVVGEAPLLARSPGPPTLRSG